jgi:hypothetical protein
MCFDFQNSIRSHGRQSLTIQCLSAVPTGDAAHITTDYEK